MPEQKQDIQNQSANQCITDLKCVVPIQANDESQRQLGEKVQYRKLHQKKSLQKILRIHEVHIKSLEEFRCKDSLNSQYKWDVGSMQRIQYKRKRRI